jgi:formylmethanofuran dehydrogenase subunit E
MMAAVPTERRPVDVTPKRACRCGECRNQIYAHNVAYRINGRFVCPSCADGYRWSDAMQCWVLKSFDAPE